MLFLPLGFLGRMSLQLYIFHVMLRELFIPDKSGSYLILASLIAGAWALERWFLEPANARIRAIYLKRPK